MRILFAGSPQLAVPSLKLVHGQFEICGVLTATDKTAGRGNTIVFSEVKQEALNLNLPIIQPEKIDDQCLETVKALSPDLLVVAAYGKIFPEKFLKIFPLGGINLHPSLLPEFRGPSPIPAAILAGKPETGITIQKLAVQMDAGDILLQEHYPLTGRETTEILTQTFSETGARLMLTALQAIKAGTTRPVAQDHSQATYCKLIKKEQGLIDWQDEAQNIERKVRAFFPWPAAFTFFNGKRLAIHEANLYAMDINRAGAACGLVLDVDKTHGLLINTGKGILGLKVIQPQAKKVMDFKAFINGHKEIVGSTLGV